MLGLWFGFGSFGFDQFLFPVHRVIKVYIWLYCVIWFYIGLNRIIHGNMFEHYIGICMGFKVSGVGFEGA